MTSKLKTLLAALALATGGLASSQTLLNGSYDVAREFYKDYN
ncbi:MAG: sulfate transporter subunit, partial [Xanthomonadaceae bacterium]|nr:sulfate transporter subunit [Xanthomonadaceae bacterium]